MEPCVYFAIGGGNTVVLCSVRSNGKLVKIARTEGDINDAQTM